MRSCPQCANVCDESHRFCPSCGFPIAEVGERTAQDDPFINRTLPGGYVVLDLVGIGGMGRVYRAEQKTLGRTVAVKVIHPHLLGDESAAARFITEARAASRLNHPNSVAVIDFGKTDDGQLYLVMEFLRGRDLSRIDYEEGPLPIRRIINVLRQTLAALGEAHHLGIIHRDLKPENIILEPLRSGGDFVKVVDFGLAKMREGAAREQRAITTPGIICGTPDYMAPEQGRGAPIDARTDLYAVGVILFQLLTGRLPFEADSPTQVVLMHLSIPPPDPRQIAPERSISEALADVVHRALAKEPDERYPSSEEFSEALALAQADLDMGRSSMSSLQVACPSCGASLPRGQKFCGECGVRISFPPGTSRAPAAPSLAGHVPSKRPPSAPRLPLPFTGRDEDLSWLEACCKNVRSSVHAARLVGDAGVGKTRVIREFVAAARTRGDWVVEAGPDPWWADVGYYTLRRTITLLARLEAGGGSDRDWTGASPEARQGLSEIFGRTAGSTSSLSPSEKRYTAAEALRWSVARASALAGRNRLILVVEDLSRVDGASRNALADMLSEPPLVPMLLLASHVHGFDPRWPDQDAARALTGLSSSAATHLVKGLPSASNGDSGAHARGTVLPMYLDQLARFALEGGSDPPSRLADLISLRIERLGPAARRVLQALAVLGDEVGLKEIEGLVQKGEIDGRPRSEPNGGGSDMTKEIAASLDELVHANMIQETPAGFCHTHPLLREIAGATIPAAVRRDLHARAASIADERELPLEVRALHTLYAQDSFEALLLLERVAERALARADTSGAIRALHNGLELARRELSRGEIDDPMRAVLIFSRKLGEALTQAGDLTDADGVLREALDLAGPAGQDRARVLRALANVAHGRSRSREAMGYLKEAIEHASRSGAKDLVASLEDMRRAWAS